MAAPGGGAAGILQAGTTEERGANARLSSFVGAMAIADLVKTTLGPKGMDKILQSVGRGKSVTVTNDGATILKSIYVDNPAARVLVDLSRVQDDEVGDGTTSVVVLAGELLREAEKLVTSGVHPMTVVAGYRAAAEAALAALESGARAAEGDALRPALEAVARTTLDSKILSHDRDHFASLAVDAVLRLGPEPDLDMIHILKKAGGTLAESWLEPGFILDKTPGVGQPKRVENARILVANTAMDTDKVKIYGARVRVDSMAAVADLEAAEKGKMKAKVNRMLAARPTVVVNRQLIYNYPESLFADAGVMAIEHADFDGVERLAKVTGAEVASTFDGIAAADGEGGATADATTPASTIRLGSAAVVEECVIGGDRAVRFSGCARREAATVVLRGASAHVLDEADRSLHDALCVLGAAVRDARVVWGGGWPEARMAHAVATAAATTPGKRALAMESFATALRALPAAICDNAGMDAADAVARLRAAHAADPDGTTAGVDVVAGGVGCMQARGVVEAFRVKRAVLLSATEAAEMILRVDEVVKAAPRPRERE